MSYRAQLRPIGHQELKDYVQLDWHFGIIVYGIPITNRIQNHVQKNQMLHLKVTTNIHIQTLLKCFAYL